MRIRLNHGQRRSRTKELSKIDLKKKIDLVLFCLIVFVLLFVGLHNVCFF